MNLDLPVRDLVSPMLRTLRTDQTLSDAWTEMLNGGFHHLPVTQDGQLVGILSASDLRAVLRDLPDDIYETGVVLDSSRTVQTLMTPDPVTITPDAPLREAFEALATGRYHALPVTTAGAVVGILTSTDLLRYALSAAST